MRVFISSTFVGLENERNYLMTKTFPMLKHEAIKRGITLIPVDLRWGVTKEQAEQGKVIWICLNEIERSKPFFISILGTRYGWQPELDILKKDTQLIHKYPNIQSDMESKLSMTEIEIQHAVLRNSEKINAFFYITDENTLEKRQKKLVEKINKDGRYALKYYHSQEELGNLIYRDIMGLLNEVDTMIDVSEFDRIFNCQCVEFSQLANGYLERSNITVTIESFVNNNQHNILTLFGSNGTGKSCILADWISRHEGDVIYLFINGLLTDKSYKAIQRYLLTVITKNGDSLIINEKNLYNQLESALEHITLNNQKYTIVLDGLEQVIEESDDVHSPLSWLPNPPKGIKYIFGTNSEEQKQFLRKRGSEVLEVLPLRQESREEIINRYLFKYSKELTNEQVFQLASNAKSKNLTLLIYMLNEMVSDSVYETVDDYINQYIIAKDGNDFYQKLLTRACNKFDENMVKEIFGLITLSKSGLKIDEIIGILNLSQIDWSQFYCAYSFIFGENNGLISIKSNEIRIITQEEFLDSSLKEKLIQQIESYFEKILEERKEIDKRAATKDEILSILNILLAPSRATDKDIITYINSFIDSKFFFEGKERALEELAHLYWNNNQLDKLYNHLLYPICLIYLQRFNFESLKKYWKYIMDNDPDKSIIDYSILDPEYEEYYTNFLISDYFFCVALLADSDSRFVDSDHIIHYLNRSIAYLDTCSLPGKEMFLESRYDRLASLYYSRKDYKKAAYYYQKMKDHLINEDSNNSLVLSMNEAQNLFDLGNYEQALFICNSVLEKLNESQLPRTIKNEYVANVYNIMGNSLSNKAHSLSNLNYLEESVLYLKKAILIYEDLMTLNPIRFTKNCAKAISNLACSLEELGLFEESLMNFDKAISLLNNLDDLENQEILAQVKTNYGSLITDLAYNFKQSVFFKYAAKELQEAQIIYQSLYDLDKDKYSNVFANALYNFGRLARRMHKYPKAIQAYETAMELNNSKAFVAICLTAMGLVYRDERDDIKANDTFNKAILLYEELYNNDPLELYRLKINQIKSLLNN